MDFIEGLFPKVKGVDTILVVVDHLSRSTHFVGLKHLFTAKSVAKVFIKEVVSLHGFPKSIVMGRDKVFLSNFWREIVQVY